MAYTHYDRLTALDSTFLDLESEAVHMHVGSVGIFDAGPLAKPDGGLDFDQVLQLAEASLRRVPRFRQKLDRVPILRHPVWVDDPHFNLLYHVRHTALPVPGDERQLKRLVGRIMSQKLDRAKPMWELWFVEGLEGGRFAVISKVHHCLIDGISGVELLGAFLSADPDALSKPCDEQWQPRPAPTRLGTLGDEIWRRATLPARAVASANQLWQSSDDPLRDAAHAARGLTEAVAMSVTPAAETPFNGPIGPHRRFDWTRFDLAVVGEVKQKLRGTVNDVALACVAGAVRQHLLDHDIDVAGIDFRVFIPVSTRTQDQRGKLGNHVSMLVARLPVGETDPRRRMDLVVEEMRRLKKSGRAEATELIEEVGDWTSTRLLTGMSRLAAARRAYNLVVTNVPGPPVPVFLSGAQMLQTYPLVPLFENQGLGIALFSYAGALHWGFNADRDAVPDLHAFALSIDREFEVLRKL